MKKDTSKMQRGKRRHDQGHSQSALKSTAGEAIHFFTIVLNGEPFIRWHLDVFRALPFNWKWHIIEGVAAHKHDTAWSLRNGSRIDDDMHCQGRSRDGSSAYLDEIALAEPERVIVYRKPPGVFWDGKLEMIRAPLANIRQSCLLWQIDADELWTAPQIVSAHRLFANAPNRSAAYFLCHYFVGPALVATTIDAYGNNRLYEWLRIWRYRPGDVWLSHEPPKLGRPKAATGFDDVGALDPFLHEETAAAGLIFQHYAYASAESAAFKEAYYGYARAVESWDRLQRAEKFPLQLSDYFPWVKDSAQVHRAVSIGVRPWARQDASGAWRFDRTPRSFASSPGRALLQHTVGAVRQRVVRLGDLVTSLPKDNIREIAVFKLDNMGDMVQTSGFLRELRKLSPSARITVFSSSAGGNVLHNCPYINKFIVIPRIDSFSYKDSQSLSLCQMVASEFQGVFDIAFNPRRHRDTYGANALMAMTSAPLRVGFQRMVPAEPNYDPDRALTHLATFDPLASPPVAAAALLRLLGAENVDPSPEIWISQKGENQAAELLSALSSGIDRLFAVGVGASQHYRRWPVAAFAALCRELPARYGATPVLIGGPEDMETAEAIAAASGVYCLNGVGRLSLDGSAALMRACDLFVGNDSGPKHVAAALGLPVVEVGWLPIGYQDDGDDRFYRAPVFGAKSVVASPRGNFSPYQIIVGEAIAAVAVADMIAAIDAITVLMQ